MWNFKVRDVETPASTTFLLLFLLSVTQPLLWLDLNLTHKLDFWEDKTCLPTCWSRWCGGRSYIVCCLHRTGAACGTSLFFSHSSSLFLLSWRNYSIFLSRHFRFKTGGSTWSRIRLFSEGCTWKLIVLAVCWVPLLLSFSPASFPLQPPHPTHSSFTASSWWTSSPDSSHTGRGGADSVGSEIMKQASLVLCWPWPPRSGFMIPCRP